MFVFDHRTRCGPSNWHSLGKGNAESRGPLLRAHVDQSYDGAEMVLRRWFPDEADELVKRRYQIINVGLLCPPPSLLLSHSFLSTLHPIKQD